MPDFIKVLKDTHIVIDGAMGTMIQNLDVNDGDFGGSDYRMLSDLLSLSRPDDLKNIHLAYFKAGAHAVETNTFGASPLRLAEYDFSKMDLSQFRGLPKDFDPRRESVERLAYEISRSAAQTARRALEEYKASAHQHDRPLFVIGSIGPSNWVLSATPADLRLGTWEQIVDNFYQQGLGLIDGGVDVFLHETQQDILELKAAVAGSLKAMKERRVSLPIMCQVSVDQFSKMQIFNTDITAAAVTLSGCGIDTFGVNCSIGPDLMVPTAAKLAQISDLPISMIPNAGLPVSEDGQTVFKMQAEEFSEILCDMAKAHSINILGGCCGTTPDHIAKVAEKARSI